MSCEQGTCEPEPCFPWLTLALSNSHSSYLWLTRALSLWLTLSLSLIPTHSDSLWLTLALSGAHQLTRSLPGSQHRYHSLSCPDTYISYHQGFVCIPYISLIGASASALPQWGYLLPGRYIYLETSSIEYLLTWLKHIFRKGKWAGFDLWMWKCREGQGQRSEFKVMPIYDVRSPGCFSS